MGGAQAPLVPPSVTSLLSDTDLRLVLVASCLRVIEHPSDF